MSTRAIYGIKQPDGTILGAWQWNDGDIPVAILNMHFDTEEKAKALIQEGMWGSMFFSKKAKDKYKDWLVNNLYQENVDNVPYRNYVLVNDAYLLKEKHHEGRKPEVYADYKEASGQDINHIYLFNPATNKWVKDKDI